MDNITVFLDRDGVINEKAPEHEYISRAEDFHFLPGTIEAVKLLNGAGARVVIVTNQRGIARGLLSANALNELHEYMQASLTKAGAKIDKIYVCPHNKGVCRCRKPNIGLFEQAENDFDICRKESWTVGDSPSDILAGMRFGTKTVFVGGECRLADYSCKNLLAAARLIIKESIGEI